MPSLQHGANVGGRQFRGTWKPVGYNQMPPSSPYKSPGSWLGTAGAAIGFGSSIYSNWGTIAAVGTAARAGVGAAIGGLTGGPPGALAGAAAGVI